MIAARTAKVKMDSMRAPWDFDRRDFPVDVVAAAKGDRVLSVCLPARNEAATVGTIVERIVALDVVDEVVVVDDASSDRTARVAAAAGATVVASEGSGKGAALWSGLEAAKGDMVAFCDADLLDFDPGFVLGLLGPLLGHDELGFVKGRYQRAGEGGRVTELVARPLISLLFPGLAAFVQPLAGEFAARRDVLEQLAFADGYGVDLGLLIDVVALIGIERTAQVDLGIKRHRNRPLAELRVQAEEVLRTALGRAGG
jgi:glucosyl-3-phosphoglycerate synthase